MPTEKKFTNKWRRMPKNTEKPEFGERVLICIGEAFVGEGHLKSDGKWYRFDDVAPIEEYMGAKVTAWKPMPRPPKKSGRTKVDLSKPLEEPDAETDDTEGEEE